MKYMNDYDIAHALRRFARAGKPNRVALALIVARLADWANENSDGWAYWPKACRAGAKAMALIESRTSRENDEQERVDATDAEVKAALAPIKAFLTRQSVSQADRDYILNTGQEV